MSISVVGLDADDTLWESEVHFIDVEQRFRELIAAYDPSQDIQTHLFAVERRNLEYFGYGVKSFTLSMIETAIQLTDGQVNGDDVHRIVAWGKEMMNHPVDLLDGVRDTVEMLSADYRLLIITKGDLLHQEAKVAQSGLAELVDGVHIVTEKDAASYATILQRQEIDAGSFIMVGNSVKSDVLPVLEIGGSGVHIPAHNNWEFENDHDATPDTHDYLVIESIRQLPGLLGQINSDPAAEADR
ncbi:MAG: HAD family hydrolase [Acidimicrobiales bacterium]